MQKVKLPVKVDPVRNALKLLDYVGIVEKSQMPRLRNQPKACEVMWMSHCTLAKMSRS